MIRVLVADDHPIVRHGLRRLINLQADMDVVGEAADGSEVVRLLEVCACEVIVLDLSLPNRVFLRVADGAALPPGHPAAGKGLVEGRPAAYLCREMSCLPPITEPAALAAALAPEAEPA